MARWDNELTGDGPWRIPNSRFHQADHEHRDIRDIAVLKNIGMLSIVLARFRTASTVELARTK